MKKLFIFIIAVADSELVLTHKLVLVQHNFWPQQLLPLFQLPKQVI